MNWLDYMFQLVLVCGVLVIAPLAIGVFLTIGLRARRRAKIPGAWWLIMLITCGSPAIIVTLGMIFKADRPQLMHQDQGIVQQLAGLAILAFILALPIALIVYTSRLPDQRGGGWVIAPLVLLPGNFMALLVAAQLMSGVSL